MSRKQIIDAFDRDALARICAMPERRFGREFGLDHFKIESKRAYKGEDYYFFQDNGADVLAVAHLDTVVRPSMRTAHFMDTAAGPVVYSGALDDRLGTFIILDLLPKLGINCDVLLTVGEESGASTAQFFTPTKDYDWMIEFDRGGTDVVMYQYDDAEARELVRDSGAIVGEGIFTDICYLDHLGIKGFNWGVGYRDYHGPRSHAYLEDTYDLLTQFQRFHAANEGVAMPWIDDFGGFNDGFDDHKPADSDWWRGTLAELLIDPDEPDAAIRESA